MAMFLKLLLKGLLISCVVFGELSLPCDYNGDVTIKYKYFESGLVIPIDLREQSLTLIAIDSIIASQVTPLCRKHQLDVDVCSSDIVQLVHESLESSCLSSSSSFVSSDNFLVEKSHLDLINISFEGSDHRLPKMLPCDWTGSISVNIHNIDVSIPVAISINGDVGAPVKSFAQIYSFLRSSLNNACDSLIITSTDYSNDSKEELHKECMHKMTNAFEDQIVANCPLVEKSFKGKSSEFLPYIDITESGDVVIHVRSLAGDEVEHFWHIMLGELLPTVSTVLQLFDGLPCDLDEFLSMQRITVVIHNSLRPWGSSPLHKFYQELTLATDGVISFVGSAEDRPGFRLPRWDYECNDSDLIKLKESAMFLQRILVPSHSHRADVVVQERSHNKQLGSFYEKYFCDLIDKGELPYLSKESCGVYGSQRRKVVGLDKVAARWKEAYHTDCTSLSDCKDSSLQVTVAAPDSDLRLAQQIEPYVDASLMLLGHGGGMVYALFLKPNATVIEVTSPEKHRESNGAAKGLFILGQAIGLNIRRVVCFDGGAYTVDLLDTTSSEPEDGANQVLQEFTGDVSDVNTPCGALVQLEMDVVAMGMRWDRK